MAINATDHSSHPDIEIIPKISDMPKMKCSRLQPNDTVVFKVSTYTGDSKEEIYDGTVISVNVERQYVSVCYLEGYKSQNANIPFAKVLAKADASGIDMRFGGWIRGKSILLEVG